MPSAIRRPWFWAVLAVVVVIDFITKQIAVATLSQGSIRVLGDWFLFRLVYNPGAAFGIHVGEYSRWVFMGLATLALVILGSMVRHTLPEQRVRLVALGLVCGGAIGNLIDRVRSARGVVDFIDVYIGPFHWPTFNVADMAGTGGAFTLAIILWDEGRAHENEQQSEQQADPAEA